MSFTQLQTNLLREIVVQLRKSKSLLALDVSGNPGINDDLRKFLSKRIRCKENPHELERYGYVNQLMDDINKDYDNREKKNEKILQSMQLKNIREVTNTKYTNKLSAVRTF